MPMAVVAYSALRGTPPLDSRAKIFGAMPLVAMLYSMRVDAYMPELPADRMAVRITAFISPAAKASPARWKTSVNGEVPMSVTSFFSSSGSVYGSRAPIMKMANT